MGVLLIFLVVINIICAIIGIYTVVYEWVLISQYKKEIRDEHNHNSKNASKDGV